MNPIDQLEQFGYLERGGFATISTDDSPRIRLAVARFQEHFGLPVTGELDDATLTFMERPRCGFPDVGEFVTSGQKWPSPNLTYNFIELTSDKPAATVKDDMAQAFKLWSTAANLTFREVGSGGDIVIRFVSGDHGDGVAFDGPSGVLAHAFFPMAGAAISGDAHFDDAEDWTSTDLITVAAHEFGHSLGLNHTNVAGSLMYPYYSGPHRFLGEDDKAGIVSLYGPATPPVAPTVTERFIANLKAGVYTLRATGQKGRFEGDVAFFHGEHGERVDLATGIEVF